MNIKKIVLTIMLSALFLGLSFSVYSCNTIGALISGDDVTVDDITGDVADASEQAESIKALLRSYFTEEEKYYIGRSTCAYVFGKDGNKLVERTDLTSYVNKVGQTCALASNKPSAFKGYRFVVFENNHPNAYATAGGMILISTGMIRLCDNEDELAAVLAHEIEHVVKNHPMKAVDNATKNEALLNIATFYAKKAAENVEIPQVLLDAMSGSFRKMLEQVIEALDDGYSKDTEYEADRGCVNTLHTAGYNVDALKSVINKLPHKDGYGGNHPTPAERVKSIDKRITSLKINPPHPIKPSRTTRFNQAILNIK